MNKVMLIGRLARDPDVRWSQGPDQKATARFTLAVDKKVKKSEGSTEQQTADFISCITFGRPAETMEKYVVKGTKIAVTGRISTGSYVNRDGQKVYTTDVVVEEFEFVESKKSQESNGGQSSTTSSVGDGFMNIADGVEDEGLPFN